MSTHRDLRGRALVLVGLFVACSGGEGAGVSDGAPSMEVASMDGWFAEVSALDAHTVEDSVDAHAHERAVVNADHEDTARADVHASEPAGMEDGPVVSTDRPMETSVRHLAGVSCASTPPPGALRAPPLPSYSGGTCPMLSPGPNTLRTMGGERRFVLVVPSTFDRAHPSPLIFIWHWLGGSASSVVTHAMTQTLADSLGVIIVIPERKGDLALRIPIVNRDFDPAWPYLNLASSARIEEEARFFDDVIACVHAHYGVDADCISSVGISAGALWTSQLMQVRSERLASAIILSGGIGPATSTGIIDARGWTTPRRVVPSLLGWGGPIDQCALNFHTASRSLGTRLHMAGGFVEECVHNCGHTVPPVEDRVAGLRVLLRFAVDHPYWLRRGESPYLHDGLPEGTPSWCAVGVGRALPRTGVCPSAFMSCPVPAL